MKKLKIEYIDINSIKPYSRNAKQHPAEQIEQIKKSIEQFGMDDPIGIWKDEIVEGHGRLIACKELGMKEVPIIRLDHLTDEERKAYTLAHNKLTMNSDFDIDILNDELMNSFETIDMSDFGFDLDFDLLNEEEIIEDEVPDVPEEPKAKLGDIYQLGNHRLMCGDSTSEEDVAKLMSGVKADMVFTDPPYGMNLDTDYSKYRDDDEEYMKKYKLKNKSGNSYKPVIGDNEDFKDDLVLTIFNNFDYCKEIFVWGGDYYPELLKDYKKGNYIVWDKKSNEGLENNLDTTNSNNFELCWSKNKHKKDIVRILWVRFFGTEQEFDHKRYHPTQKPTKLSRWFIDKYSKENDLIVDIYGGSGSTLIACEQLNRKCYMMELDPHYIDVIIQRWENFTGEKAVLIERKENE